MDICGSGGSKSRLAKAAGAEPSGQTRDEKLHAVVARSTFPSRNVQNTPAPDHFWKLGCRKSTHPSFRRQNVQNTSASDDFWKLRCQKSARCCGVKHISKSKVQITTPASDHICKLRCRKSARHGGANSFRSQNVQNSSVSDHFCKLRCRKSAHSCGLFQVKMLKTPGFGPLLEVAMSKKCTPLWREAHFQVKMLKTPGFGALLEVQMSKSARRCGAKRISKSKC